MNQQKKIRLTGLLLAITLTTLLAACAKQGYPSGGPKDETPPVAGTATPPSGTTHFDAKTFSIPFDEYVTIQDAENNILVSPPMKHKPEYSTKGRNVVVRIKDTLQPNTTYLFQFKRAIVDLNEGNPLESLDYAFSTGSALDSMSYSGMVVDALTQQPGEDEVTVMLYDKSAPDSAVAKEQPLYVTRSNKQGSYHFSNIRPGEYRLVALKDENRDMKLTEGEAVAFSDTLVTSIYKAPATKDTAQNDTATSKNSSPLDQRQSLSLPKSGSRSLLLLSADSAARQRVVKSDFLSKGRIMIVMQSPLKDYSLDIATADGSPSKEHLVAGLNTKRDTLSVWTQRADCDSIVLVMHTEGRSDTLHLKMRKTKPRRPAMPPSHIKLVSGTLAQQTPYYDTLRMSFVNPLRQNQPTILVTNLADSSTAQCPIHLDSLGLHGWVECQLKAGAHYQLHLDQNVLQDIYGNKGDSITMRTEVTTPEQYGTLIITLLSKTATDGQYVLELLDEKDQVMTRQTVVQPGKVRFEHLKGGKYRVRAVIDSNRDGLWTPGNFWQHRQPEQVTYLPKTLDLRENWDMEERFEL